MKFSPQSLTEDLMLFNKRYLKWKVVLLPKFSNFTFIQDYRVWTNKLLSRYSTDNTNFEMLVNMSLFTFAFSQMIWLRYQENSLSYFLKNTFPGVCLPCQTLSWDTFSTLFFDNQSFQLRKVDMYPDSILLSTESNKYFNQKLVDIGVFPLKQDYSKELRFPLSSLQNIDEQNPACTFTADKMDNNLLNDGMNFVPKEIGKIGPTWSSFFSYRLHSNSNLFMDEFPSKLDSTVSAPFSFFESEMEVVGFPDSIPEEEKNTLALKLNKFSQTGKLSNQNFTEYLNSIKKIKLPINFEELQTVQLDKESPVSKMTGQNSFVFKAFFIQKPLITTISNSNLIQTGETLSSTSNLKKATNQNLQNEVNPSRISSFTKPISEMPKEEAAMAKRLQFVLKKSFFSKGIKNLSNEVGVSPFSSIETIFQSTNDKDWDEKAESFNGLSSSEQICSNFADVYPREALNLLESLRDPKPTFWFHSKLRSGFLYPDNDNVRLLIQQSIYQKNSALSFSNHNLKRTNPAVFFKKNIFQPEVLPIEVTFHASLAVPQIQKTGQNQKKQIFGLKYHPISLIFENQTYYKGDGLLTNRLTSDVDLSNKSEVNKWAKKYFSHSNFLTDRKDSFLGVSDKETSVLKTPTFLSRANFVQVEKNKEQKIQEVLIPADVFQKVPQHLLKIKPELQYQKDFFLDYYYAFFKRLPVVLCNENWQIPYLQTDEWEHIAQKAFFDKVKTQDNLPFASGSASQSQELGEALFDERVELSIPLIRIAIPMPINSISQPWPRTFIDYNADELRTRFSGLVNPTDLTDHSLPWSRSQWNQNLVSQRHFNNLYKRETTIFSPTGDTNSLSNVINQASTPFFFQACFNNQVEPFTLNSWMILHQFCFVLFCLKVCQSCYQEYGKEVLVFLIEALESLGVVDEGLKEEFQLDTSGTSFQVFKSVPNRFKDAAGIDGILPDLSEIVWFLRNSGRFFKIGKVIPKGLLFVGPPGTGKTFLAKAIAAEAEVPILVQSGSTLSVPGQSGKGAERLKNLFSKARELAPCIIFLDEIDTLGKKRQHIIGNPMGQDGMFEALGISDSTFDSTPEFSPNRNQFIGESTSVSELAKTKSAIFSGTEQNLPSLSGGDKQGEQLNILTQFLVEMDGMESRQGIIVIGATNRPALLDPAFTRPGRFDQILPLRFPEKQARVELLKLYSKNLGIDSSISWNYFASLTDGCSHATLSAAMNKSSIQAILNDTTHTVQTIEQGLGFIQSSTHQNPILSKKNRHDPFFIKRLAYSQAGKAVLYTLLPQHPPCIFISLWKPLQATKNESKLRKYDSFSTRFQLENILVGFYAGKACELLMLFKSWQKKPKTNFSVGGLPSSSITPSYTLWESDLNEEDIRQGTLLAQFMVSKWYFYSKKISLKKWNSIVTNQNDDDTSLFKNLTVLTDMNPRLERSEKNWQTISLRAWWRDNVIKQTESLNRFSGDWYRIYLADPEQNLRNEEFIPSDQYYHDGDRSVNLLQQSSWSAPEAKVKKSSIYWNDLYKNHRDSLYQALVLSSFNKAFLLLDQNRELIDSFADYLLRYETIRENEIFLRFRKFKIKLKNKV